MSFTIKFDHGFERVLPQLTDESIERQREIVERTTGRKLPLDDRTNYPNFTIYEDGEEHSGG